MESYRVIDTTERFGLYHLYEQVYLYDKQKQYEIYLGAFYGDPSCGLISQDNTFCIIGGLDKWILYRYDKITIFDNWEILPAFDIRQISASVVQILTDPWPEQSAIWSLEINTLKVVKIKDFDQYLNKPYCENIIW